MAIKYTVPNDWFTTSIPTSKKELPTRYPHGDVPYTPPVVAPVVKPNQPTISKIPTYTYRGGGGTASVNITYNPPPIPQSVQLRTPTILKPRLAPAQERINRRARRTCEAPWSMFARLKKKGYSKRQVDEMFCGRLK